MEKKKREQETKNRWKIQKTNCKMIVLDPTMAQNTLNADCLKTPPQLKGRDCQTGFKRSATSSYALSVRNIL